MSEKKGTSGSQSSNFAVEARSEQRNPRLKMGRRLRNTFGRKGDKHAQKLEACQEIDDSFRGNENDGENDDIESHEDTSINYNSNGKRMSLDYPPQIDFYQNTLTAGRTPFVRPTMMELIREKIDPNVTTDVPSEMSTFQERNQYVLNNSIVLNREVSDWHRSPSMALFNSFRSLSQKFSLAKSLEAHAIKEARSTAIEKENAAITTNQTAVKKFGWIEGVLIRCMASIFGVMLYLRISWVAGQCGLLLGSCVILLGTFITTITALSTSAICTNGVVKGGGAYYLISRSLGPEFGGSIGVIFSLANAVGAAMYIVGFAETILDVFTNNGITIIDGGLNDVRIIGLVASIFVIGVIIVGLSFESKMQIILMVVLYASIFDYLLGTFFEPTDEQKLRGVTGYRIETIKENLLPMFRNNYDFFGVFAVYFPASTGIMAGANISGDLRNPQKAIPLGTLLAIFVTSLIYLIMLWTSGATNLRDADGTHFPQLLSMLNDTIMMAATTSYGDENNAAIHKLLTGDGGLATIASSEANEPEIFPINVQYYVRPACVFNQTCEYGLLNYFQIVRLGSFFGPFVTLSIATSTLSSALVSMVGAPKIFQAVARDKLFPYINRFGRGHGPNQEPRSALFLCAIIVFAIIMIGDLNAIAPIISNFFLCSYALINYACFDNSFAHSPGFRPSFKYYNMWVSLIGAFMCVFVMFIISWWTALLTFFFFTIIFVYLSRRKPEVNWGTSTQAHCYRNALQYVSRLERIDEHVKNYRPQILVLTGNPAARISLTEFAYSITKGTSLMLCGYVIPYVPCKTVFGMIQKLNELLRIWFKTRHIKAFPATVADINLRAGVQTLIQTAGLGKLKPNIILMGYKNVWEDNEDAQTEATGGINESHNRDVGSVQFLSLINDYFGIIQDAFVNNMSLGILRNGNSGLDITNSLFDVANINEENEQIVQQSNTRNTSHFVTSAAVQKAIASRFASIRSNESTISEKPSVTSTRRNSSSTQITTVTNSAGGTLSSAQGAAALKESASERAIDCRGLENQTFTTSLKSHNYRPPIIHHSSLLQDSQKNVNDIIQLNREDVGVQTTPFASQRGSLCRKFSNEAGMGRTSNEYTCFQRRVRHGRIDVWWLYDDGGLTLLIPYLLAQPKSYLEGAHLRVFTLSSKGKDHRAVLQEQQSFITLLAKFRINAASVTVIPDRPAKRPSEKSLAKFDALVKPFMALPKSSSENNEDTIDNSGRITITELKAHEQKTWRQLRLSELLALHSSSADLIVVTLPVPRSGSVSASLYMAWLDVISRDLPPTLMLRGNQQSVLTFYS